MDQCYFYNTSPSAFVTVFKFSNGTKSGKAPRMLIIFFVKKPLKLRKVLNVFRKISIRFHFNKLPFAAAPGTLLQIFF